MDAVSSFVLDQLVLQLEIDILVRLSDDVIVPEVLLELVVLLEDAANALIALLNIVLKLAQILANNLKARPQLLT